jgi:hypothetical protein
MIITKVIGGLGNQMFQYAAGRCLADLNKTELKLDVTGFTDYKFRNFDLLKFNIRATIASDEEIRRLLPSHNFQKAFQYLKPKRNRNYYREKYFHFDENFQRLGSNVYVKGYFQSEKCFLPAKDNIKQDFLFKQDVLKGMQDFTANLNGEKSVSVHIRRGDISEDSGSFIYHGVLSADYYYQAIQLIQSKLPNPHFYFFSDDIQWVKDNLQVPGAVYVSGEITKNHIEDLYLMSQCRHNIIANSSFSWWGAWLNDNPDKIVIAPKKWFNKGPKDTQDLIPEGWIKI